MAEGDEPKDEADEAPEAEASKKKADEADEGDKPARRVRRVKRRADDAGAAVASETKPEGPRGGSYAFLVGVSAISLALDLGSKWWVTARLDDPRGPLGGRFEVVKDRVAFISAKNKGGAWGLFGEMPEWFRRAFFLAVSVAAVWFILSLYRKLEPGQRVLKWGLPLVLGGALGNFVDRIRYGHVVDFIDVRLSPTFHWPTFNIADIAICIGVGLMALDMLPKKKSVAASTG